MAGDRTIVPVEIWDLPSAGKLLQERRADRDFPSRLAAALAAWTPPVAFERVHVMGGAATRAIAGALPWPTTLDDDPFTAARAHAPCADVGQTGVKLATRDRAWRVERDLARAPLRDGADREPARASTIAWLREVLAALAGPFTLGLPCELVGGVPRSCTYAFRDPDPMLVAELGVPIVEVVNDAVLAARASGVPAGTLVLTIGFGVGGALVI